MYLHNGSNDLGMERKRLLKKKKNQLMIQIVIYAQEILGQMVKEIFITKILMFSPMIFPLLLIPREQKFEIGLTFFGLKPQKEFVELSVFPLNII